MSLDECDGFEFNCKMGIVFRSIVSDVERYFSNHRCAIPQLFFFLTTNDPDVVSSTGDVFGITQVLFFYRSCLTNIIYWTFVRNSVKIPYKGLAVLVLV